MDVTKLDINRISRLIIHYVDQVTCIECCKYYMIPSTAPCGHTMCHGCWTGRKKCAICGIGLNRKSLKLNLHLQKITEHTQELEHEFKKLFKVNLDEFLYDTPIEKESSKDPTKNVRDWLANSDNQFSAPAASQQSTQEFINPEKEIGNKVQVQSETSKTNSKNIIYVGVPQDDWDKIEEMPDTEEINVKNKENVIGPMDIEPYEDDLFEFTTDNPRRSSRKRDVKGSMLHNTDINVVDQNSTKSSTYPVESKVSKKNWPSVKRIKKEYSKLNKRSKNKLNVSFEKCKKTLIPPNKNKHITTVNNSKEIVLNADDNSPNINNPKDCNGLKENMSTDQLSNNKIFKDVDGTKMQNNMECKTQKNQYIKNIVDNIIIEKSPLSHISNKISPPHLHSKNDEVPPVAFIVKGALQAPSIKEKFDCCDNNVQTIIVNTDDTEQTKSTEDIEITIKIGNTVTNICIKKKDKDVQLKIKADREIQTSLEKCIVNNKKDAFCSPIKEVEAESNVIISVPNNEPDTFKHVGKHSKLFSSNKTLLSKKNTESAETATVQYEITESIEKELSKEMEKADIDKTQISSKVNTKMNTDKQVPDNEVIDEDCLNDLDLFDNDSVKEGNVQSLKSSNHATSEILISTMKSNRTEKQVDKRVRDSVSDDLPVSKKMKVIYESNETGDIHNTSKTTQMKNLDHDSESTNYDFIMGKVFANIDLDLAKKNEEKHVKASQLVNMKKDKSTTPLNYEATTNLCNSIQGQSENVFSLLEKENDVFHELPIKKTQVQIENEEAPPIEHVDHVELINHGLSTPIQDNDDHSDESIVEETPQKSASFHKLKQKSGGSLNAENTVKNKTLKLKRAEPVNAQNKYANTPNITSVTNLSDITDDTVRKSKHATVMETSKSRPTLETPLTITNFVEQIKHKSTPMAKKSLKFNNENTDNCDVDPEQTLCPSSFLAAKTTQEKEFMCKAFEDSPCTREKSPLTMRHLKIRSVKYCLAGSCLTPSEIANIKILCSLRNWDYVDKYTKDLTHLVVGVDEDNKSQRSVKYMCALAASKWIVSYEWIQKCLQMKKVVDEEPYEALDNTGEPGPQRSRLSKQKLFQGITFFCMPPFSVLDVDTLKGMLEAAGGRVVNEAKAVRVTSNAVSLLLAEPEHTQENKFIYLAMELCIVPVNSEWVLNCLGSYTISSVQELLLCPESLLPPATAQWPHELMAKEFD